MIINREDVLFLMVLFSWIYMRWRRPVVKPWKWNIVIVLIVFFAGLIFFEMVFGLIQGSDIKLGVIVLIRPYIYLPLGFLIWMDILRRVTSDEFFNWLKSISWLTVGLTVLYIFSAMGMKIYPDEPYQLISVGSAIVIRDFVTFPHWVFLSIFTLLSEIGFKKLSSIHFLINIIGVSVLLSGILFSLTRSVIFSVMFCVALLMLFVLLRMRNRKKILVFMVLIIFFLSILIIAQIAPANWQTLTDRFSSLDNNLMGGSLGFRLMKFNELQEYLNNKNIFFGVGLNPTALTRSQGPITYWGDMMWFTVLFYFGWVGMGIVIFVLIFSLIQSGRGALVLGQKDLAISWIFFLLCIFYLITSLTTESYFMFYAVSFFGIAGVTVQESGLWVKEGQIHTRSFMALFDGLSTDWILKPGKYYILRRIVFIVVMCCLAILVGIRIAK